MGRSATFFPQFRPALTEQEGNMSGERGLGAAQFGIGSGSGTGSSSSAASNNNGSANNNYQQKQQFTNYNHSCCSSGYPDVGRVQVRLHFHFIQVDNVMLIMRNLLFAGYGQNPLRFGGGHSIS